MKNPNHLFVKILISIVLLLSVSNKATASHIVGLDLFYTYVSGNTYSITLVAYGDCGPASASAFSTLPTCTPFICIYDGNTLVDNVLLAVQPPDVGLEITPVCPGIITQCADPASAIPGIKKFVYTATYTLPHTSNLWRFLFTGNMGSGSLAGRAAAITNIVSGTITELVDTLDNTITHNSNPNLTVGPTPYFCLDNSDNYNPGAIDPDGDSLVFFLVDGECADGSTSCIPGGPVSYTGFAWPGQPITATTPLNVSGPSGFSFNQHTGQISFFPNVMQRCMVAYNIEEFRGNRKVGTCQREMTFLILTCTDVPPSGVYSNNTAGNIIDSTDFVICTGAGPFSIQINPTEVDTNNNITVTPSGIPAGATFNIVNNTSHHPKCTFTWSTTGVAPGVYVFYLTFNDNNCPIAGSQTRAFTINITKGVVANGGAICPGSTATLTAFGGTSYNWSPPDGLSCTSCPNPIASPSVTTVYTVTSNVPAGCINTDTAIVVVGPPPPAPPVISPVFYCQFMTGAPLIALGSNLLWYTTPYGGFGSATVPIPNTSTLGTFTFYVSQTVNGCESPRDSIKVIVLQSGNTGFEYEVHPGCFFDTVFFTNTSNNIARYTWIFGDGKVDTATNPIHFYRAHTNPFTYPVKLLGANPCYNDSTIKDVAFPASAVTKLLTNITPSQTIPYGNSLQLNANGAWIYLWAPNDGSLSNPNINNPVITPTHDTTYRVYGTDHNGCLDSGFVDIRLTYEYENIPDAFTPNGDGLNDVFRFVNVNYGKLVDFCIYNRWGQLLFKTTDPQKGWDGTFNGVPQDLDVYTFQAIIQRPDGNYHYYKGDVTLIR